MELPGYETTAVVHDGTKSILYRATRKSDRRPVLLKCLKHEHPTPEEVARLKYELAIGTVLASKHVARPLAFVEHRNRPILVLEDVAGQALASLIGPGGLPLDLFFRIAIPLAESVGELHKAGLIHKDIKPHNVIVRPEDGAVSMIDFGLSSRIGRARQQAARPSALEGTLPYVSPEQTGRMNRGLDERSDLYSLGVTYYEMLAGHVPFASSDWMEMVHAHVAVRPRPIPETRPDVPQQLWAVVRKLLEKSPEDRYQTAAGLVFDLAECKARFEASLGAAIDPFDLGRRDLIGRVQLPERLFGRDAELHAVAAAFERASAGGAELVLLTGPAGIGKSALVRELDRTLVRAHGRFAAGKFDALERMAPYSGLIEAMKDLVEGVLRERAEEVALLRARILGALGASARVMIDVVPALELIVGAQPEVAPLGPMESQNRFNLLFLKLIGALATRERPLALFLDDLHWADSASLKLLKNAATDPEISHLLIVASWRDAEVTESHPLALTIDAVRSAGARITEIRLRGLERADTVAYLEEVLRLPAAEVEPLARLLLDKTEGNPFYLGQYLISLDDEGFLRFDSERARWTWDLEEIRRRSLADNVVELMTSKALHLSPDTRGVLEIAAAIGSRFDLGRLATASERPAVDIARLLWPAVQEGLVLPHGDGYDLAREGLSHRPQDIAFQFLHDRVRQAVYSLIKEPDRKATHLKIGRLMLAGTDVGTDARDADVSFEIVDHLDAGLELVVDPGERRRLAALNLASARRAARSTAYDSASAYLEMARRALPSESWEHAYALAHDVHLESARVLMILGRIEEADRWFSEVAAKARAALEKAACFEVWSEVLQCAGRSADAYAKAAAGLELLGEPLPATPEAAEAKTNALMSVLLDRAPEALADFDRLPDGSGDAPARLRGRLYDRAIISAYFSKPADLGLVISSSVDHCRRTGLTQESSVAIVWFAMIAHLRGNIEVSLEYAELAVRLADRFQDPYAKGRVDMLAWCMCLGWKHPFAASEASLNDTYHLCHANGDLQYASYALLCEYIAALVRGRDGHQVLNLALRWRDYCQKYVPLELGQARVRCWVQETLLGETAPLDTAAIIDGYQAAGNLTDVCESLNDLVRLAALSGDFEKAYAHAERAEPMIEAGAAGTLLFNMLYFHHFGVACARLGHKDKLDAIMKRLDRWAELTPSSFSPFRALVRAERSRALGDNGGAILDYQQAITQAEGQGNLLLAATAHEYLGELLKRQESSLSSAHFAEAHGLYRQYGAVMKARMLEAQFPSLRDRHEPATDVSTTTLGASRFASAGGLDLGTVVKAAQALASEIDLVRLVERILTLVMENVGAERAVFVLERDGKLAVAAEASTAQIRIAALSFESLEGSTRLSPAVVRYVARSLKPLILDDARAAGGFTADPYVATNSVRSLLCAPLVHQGRLMGLVYLENNLADGAFTPERIELMRVLSAQMAVAVDNARLYSSLEEKVKERTRDLTQALENLKAMQAHLVQSEKLASLGGLVAGIAHEINTPIGIGVTAASHLEQSVGEFERHYAAGALKRSQMEAFLGTMKEGSQLILSNLERAAELVKSFKQVAADQSSGSLRALRLREYVDDVLLSLRPRLKHTGHRLEIECPNELSLTCDAGAFAQTITNLVMNSVIHGYPNGGSGTLSVKAQSKNRRVRIEYADDGAGIPPEILPKIFDPFFTTRRGQGGTGLGLYVVYNLVTQRMRGRIEVSSTVGQGTHFVLDLPIEAGGNDEPTR